MSTPTSTTGPDPDAPGAAPQKQALSGERVPAEETPARCRNCGAQRTTPFCGQCGQKAVRRAVPLAELGQELLAEVFRLDARVLRTLRLLFAKPGALTEEYFAGRRKRYVPPLRMYLFVGFFYFLLVSLPGINPYVSGSPSPRRSSGDPAAEVDAGPAGPSQEETVEGEGAEEGSEKPFLRKVGYAAGKTVREYFSVVLFMFVPLVALFLRLLYHRRGYLYVHHLIFVVHLQTFFFMAEMPRMIVDGLLPDGMYLAWEDVLFRVTCASVVVYTALAVRRYYAESLQKAVLKALLLSCFYVVALLIILVALLVFHATATV